MEHGNGGLAGRETGTPAALDGAAWAWQARTWRAGCRGPPWTWRQDPSVQAQREPSLMEERSRTGLRDRDRPRGGDLLEGFGGEVGRDAWGSELVLRSGASTRAGSRHEHGASKQRRAAGRRRARIPCPHSTPINSRSLLSSSRPPPPPCGDAPQAVAPAHRRGASPARGQRRAPAVRPLRGAAAAAVGAVPPAPLAAARPRPAPLAAVVAAAVVAHAVVAAPGDGKGVRRAAGCEESCEGGEAAQRTASHSRRVAAKQKTQSPCRVPSPCTAAQAKPRCNGSVAQETRHGATHL